MRRICSAVIVLLVMASNALCALLDDRPAEFRFDPVTQFSLRFEPAMVFDGSRADGYVEVMKQAGGFTLEAFCKPDELKNLKPGTSRPVIQLMNGDRVAVQIELHRKRPPHAHAIWRAVITQPDGKPVVLERQRYRDVMYPVTDRFRHFAVVVETESKVASFYIDYTLQASVTLSELPADGTLTLKAGESTDGNGYAGMISSPTVRQELPPWDFLRATPHDLNNAVKLNTISFKPTPGPLPADSGHVDLRLRFGALGDGVHDDTAALQRAFEELDNRVPIAHNTLYIPEGTYLVSQTCAWSRYLVVQGAGSGKTIIKLKDSAAGFDDVNASAPIIKCTNYGGRGRGSGSAMSNFLFGVTIDSGTGNPGAIGVSFHTNNHGAMRDVVIRSGDGAGSAGIDMTTPWPGPGLIEDVTINGFDTGIRVGHREYSMVFVNCDLKNQNEVGIDNRGNSLSIERLTSTNRVPAIRNSRGGLVVLVNSTLVGGETAGHAIENESVLHVRGLLVDGYGMAIQQTSPEKKSEEVEARTITDRQIRWFNSHAPVVQAKNAEQPLQLPIQITPKVRWGNVTAEWVNIRKFESSVQGDDWGPALQQAIDSGARTIYFPEGTRVTIRTPVVIRGQVQRFFGMKNSIKLAKGVAADQPLISIDTDVPTIIFERLWMPPVLHVSAGDVVARDTGSFPVVGTEGCGRLFLDDSMGIKQFNRHQRIWARQLNCESKGDIPEIDNDGAQLWVLGYKTEYASINLVNRNGAKTEILGGLIYPVQRPPADMPMFVNSESDLTLVHAISAYVGNHKIYIRDTQQGTTEEVRDYRWFGGRMLQPMYFSRKR